MASVKEKTLRSVQERMPEQIREHLAAQLSKEDQQWLKVSDEVGECTCGIIKLLVATCSYGPLFLPLLPISGREEFFS